MKQSGTLDEECPFLLTEDSYSFLIAGDRIALNAEAKMRSGLAS